MAKVMVSLPDELLASLDAEAERKGKTRSGLLRDYVDAGVRDRALVRARRIEELMKTTSRHGGNGVEELKRLRPPT